MERERGRGDVVLRGGNKYGDGKLIRRTGVAATTI